MLHESILRYSETVISLTDSPTLFGWVLSCKIWAAYVPLKDETESDLSVFLLLEEIIYPTFLSVQIQLDQDAQTLV